MSDTQKLEIEEILEDTTLIEKTLRRAVREALMHHKRAGNPVVIWKEGRVEWIAPEDLKIMEEP